MISGWVACWFRLLGSLSLVGGLFGPVEVCAAPVLAVLSGNSEAYQSVLGALRARLEPQGHEVRALDAGQLDRERTQDARLIVCVGVRAAERLAELPGRIPVLVVLVPRQWFVSVGRALLDDAGRRPVSAIVIDQPDARRVALIRLAFPASRKVGLLVSRAQAATLPEIERALRDEKLQPVSEIVDSGVELIAPLERVLAESDLLLAQPDPGVLNSNTAQILLLTSYRYRDPVVGYSRSLTTAGALLSLHSSPVQIGQQAAEWAGEFLAGAAKPPSLLYPRYFEVSVNPQVARSLGVSVPTATELEQRLGRAP